MLIWCVRIGVTVEIANAEVLNEFVRSRPDAYSAMTRWRNIVEASYWRHPHDAENGFPGARHLKGSRLTFNIGGNKFRLVAWVDYENEWLEIRFIGTHAEYDDIDPLEV